MNLRIWERNSCKDGNGKAELREESCKGEIFDVH